MDSGIRVEYARLVCQQWHAQRVPWRSMQQRCADCGRVRKRTQIRSNCWIHRLTANGFFSFRGRDVAITMNSVRILHAVRSAITATAELLVLLLAVSYLLIETVLTADWSAGPWAAWRWCHYVSKDYPLWHSTGSAQLRWWCHVSWLLALFLWDLSSSSSSSLSSAYLYAKKNH